jgi:endonuclease/exonuclease/phosphatase family metal-dependent hydrolase
LAFSKKIISRLFLAGNILVVFIYLLTCLVPYLNAGKFWFISIIGLVFPLLFCAVAIFLAAWLIVGSRWYLLSLIALVISFQQVAVAFGWHPFQTFTNAKAPGNLRVLSWNVSSWDELNKEKKGGTSYRPLMFAEIKKYDADILCFQEFLESRNLAKYDATIPELQKMGYPYHYYIPGYSELKYSEMGMVIFSKYPITNTGVYDFGDGESVQQLIYTDIDFKGKPIRVFSIHLQSVRFGEREYQSLDQIKHSEKSGLKDSKTIVSKLKRGYHFRSIQSDIVHDFVQKSPYPVILCGDFNDVPNSYTYFTVKGNMQDAFLQKGAGLGRTFRFISPTLRIDYIFADKKFDIQQYHRLTVPYSDHYGIMADMSF